MFSTCLFCHSRLGKNEVVEHFPVGSRLAFDSARGRLWAVCPGCRRWNLSPLDDRWEAIEECERLFRSTRARVSTENIGLAPLASGVDLIRIGQPLRPEFAAWRYGSQLKWRRRRAGYRCRRRRRRGPGRDGRDRATAARGASSPLTGVPWPRRERSALGRARNDRDGHQGPLAVGARRAPSGWAAGSASHRAGPSSLGVGVLHRPPHRRAGATPRARRRRDAVRRRSRALRRRAPARARELARRREPDRAARRQPDRRERRRGRVPAQDRVAVLAVSWEAHDGAATVASGR